MSKIRKIRFTAVLAFLVVTVSLAGYWFIWRPAVFRAQCRLQLRNYDVNIQSCGVDLNAPEAWKDTKKTELMVKRIFDQAIPKCPAGGEHFIAYGRKPPHEWLPSLRCSLHGGGGPLYCEDDAITKQQTERQRKSTACAHRREHPIEPTV